MLRILFEWLELAFQCLERLFEWLEFAFESLEFKQLEVAFECFESRSNGWNLHSSASNPVRIVGIGIRVL